MGAAWLSTHLFEHYAFGLDAAFLLRAYPTMKEASEFLLDFLVEDSQGRLVTNPSHSPENSFLDASGHEVVDRRRDPGADDPLRHRHADVAEADESRPHAHG